jgi:hypothetical protein
MAALLVFPFHFHMEYKGQGGTGFTSNWLGIITEGHTGGCSSRFPDSCSDSGTTRHATICA